MPSSYSDRLIAGTAAFLLVLGIIALQNMFLNRIHSNRNTGESLSMYLVGGQRSLKDLMHALADIIYTVLNAIVVAAVIEAVSSIILAISINPNYLSDTPFTAASGFIVGLLTVIVGYKNINRRSVIFISMTQRFLSAVTSGILLSTIIAFVIVIGNLTLVSIAVGVFLIGIGFLLVYTIPIKVTNDLIIYYPNIFRGIFTGAMIGGGLITALYTQLITLSSLILIGEYCSIIWVGLLILATIVLGKALSKIWFEIYTTSYNNDGKRLPFYKKVMAFIKAVASSLFQIFVDNIFSVAPAVLILIKLRSVIASSISSFFAFNPKEMIIVSAFLLAVIVVGIIKPKWLLELIPFIKDSGLNTSYSVQLPPAPYKPPIVAVAPYKPPSSYEEELVNSADPLLYAMCSAYKPPSYEEELERVFGNLESKSTALPSRPTTVPSSKAAKGQEVEAARCPFSGVISLVPDQIMEASVAKVECPVCGAMRTVHPQGNTVVFPSHPKRRTGIPRDEVRWIRSGTTWELSERKA